MKKWIFLPVALFSAATSFAQYITADEMIEKTKCRTFECYKSFISGKGFSFLKTDYGTNDIIHLFTSDETIAAENPQVGAKNTSVNPFCYQLTPLVGSNEILMIGSK